jgi:site-specific recombinase XerD
MLKDGSIPIYLRITVDGKRAEISIQLSVNANSWNSKKGRVKGSLREATIINTELDLIYTKLYELNYQMAAKGESITAKRLKDTYTGKAESKKSLLVLYKTELDRIEGLIGKGYAKSTYTKYKTSYGHFKMFLKLKLRCQDLLLVDIRNSISADYDYYLRAERGIGNNTVMKYMEHLRKIVYIAISNGYLTKDPFSNYKIKTESVKKIYLIESEVNQLIETSLEIDRLTRVQDVFIFCCHTGLSFSDVRNLTKDNIVIGIDGNKWISSNRKKTNEVIKVPLLDICLAIIEKYQNNPYSLSENKLLPVLSNQKMNKYLKEVADYCKISKNLTTHVARHTFATMALTKGISLATVSRLLSHKSVKTTQIYAQITDVKVAEEMRLLRNG